MNYQETVNYLFALYPNLANNGWGAYKPGLERVYALSNLIDNPQKKYPLIHIAGTNGKGSVTHILASVLQQSGYKVGVFCSPHLVDFRERIKINGEYIPEKFVVDFVKQNDEKFKEVGPSFFEYTTMMAFNYFYQEKVDIAIIETGLGGRLDCTNIVEPILSIITNIGLDHQKFLGDTIPQIALEKAGIIKSNVPVVIGKTQTETERIFKAAAIKNKSDIYFAAIMNFPEMESDLQGLYQQENIKTVQCALEVLQSTWTKISPHSIAIGVKNVVKNTNFLGRWQVVQQQPKVIVDTAHNVDGITILIQQLQQLNQPITLITGFASDKNIDEILELFPPNFSYIFTSTSNSRMLSAEDLAQKASKYKLNHQIVPNISLVSQYFLKDYKGIYIIAGSNYIVGDFLKAFR